MRLWKKLSLLGKAFTSRRELEEELSLRIRDLQSLEANLQAQIRAIETAKLILENDELNLAQLLEHMKHMNQQVVIDMRDWQECRLTILELSRGVGEQVKQLNGMQSVTKTLKSKIETQLANAELIRRTLNGLGQVIKWTKPKS